MIKCPFCQTPLTHDPPLKTLSYYRCTVCPGNMKIAMVDSLTKQFSYFRIYTDNLCYRLTYSPNSAITKTSSILIYQIKPELKRVYIQHCPLYSMNPQQAYELLNKIVKLQAFL